MIQNEVRAFVEARVRAANAQADDLLLLFENQPDTHVDGEPFLSVWTIFGDTLRKSVGRSVRKMPIGFVQIDSLTPIGEGLEDARRRGIVLVKDLEQRSFSLPSGASITFRESKVSNLRPYGGYQRVMVRIGFWGSVLSRT